MAFKAEIPKVKPQGGIQLKPQLYVILLNPCFEAGAMMQGFKTHLSKQFKSGKILSDPLHSLKQDISLMPLHCFGVVV